MNKQSLHRARAGQQGFSLVELMIAMLTGMGVVAALMASYWAVFQSNRHGKAMSQVTEDASVALNILRSHLSLTGYSRPVGPAPNPGTGYVRAYTGATLAGCDGTFANTAVAIGALGCTSVAVGNTASDSLALAYEADARNSLATATGAPMDCLGNTYAISGAAPSAYYLAYHRFYVATSAVSGRNALYCLGPGNAAGQALVENILDMQVLYGVDAPVAGVLPRAVRYLTASQLANGTAANIANAMGSVVSVRVCLLVTSDDEVLDEVTTYRDCRQNLITPADRRLYKAFYSTVVLNNRLGAL